MEHNQVGQEDIKIGMNNICCYNNLHEPDDIELNKHDVMPQNEGEEDGNLVIATPDPHRLSKRK